MISKNSENIKTIKKDIESWQVLTFISHLLLVFNSSINIVIYCWKDEKFKWEKLTNKFHNKTFQIPGKFYGAFWASSLDLEHFWWSAEMEVRLRWRVVENARNPGGSHPVAKCHRELPPGLCDNFSQGPDHIFHLIFPTISLIQEKNSPTLPQGNFKTW